MTIEQAKECLNSIVLFAYCDEKDVYEFEEVRQAINLSIKSLDMWDKIVEQINTKYGHILKATKYGNKDAEQQSFSYSNVLMYEVADILDDILDDIEGYNEKYKKEIEE